MSEAAPTARPLVAWMDVLDQIDRSLGQSLATTPEPLADDTSGPAGNHVARLDERLAAWQSSLETVERQATASTDRLNAEHAAFSEWLEKLGRIRDGLIRWLDAGQPA